MVDLTLLEVHLDGAEFTANAPFAEKQGESADGGSRGLSLGGQAAEAEVDESEGKSGNPLVSVAAFAGLVLAVLAIRRVLGGSGEPVYEE